MGADAVIVAACSGALGAALSLVAACYRYNRSLVIALIFIAAALFATPVFAQVPGKEPGWFLDDNEKKQPETKPSQKVKIIERKNERKTVVVIRKSSHHARSHLLRHKKYWHRCRGWFGIRYWCWKR